MFEEFKTHKVKAKRIFSINEITKRDAHAFISEHHYLGDTKFFSKQSFGLFHDDTLVGVATYSDPQGTMTMKSWFGNNEPMVVELSRLCVIPDLNGTNATSYLLANSMKMLDDAQAVITLADNSRHVGSIYQVCNFRYYGLTDEKKDFYLPDGNIQSRGKTKGVRGVWIPRTRKHRYAYLLDRKLKPKLKEKPRPSVSQIREYNQACCDGTLRVYDRRFDE